MEEITINASMGELYGILTMPDTDTAVPLIILSHGFGGNHTGNQDYSDYFVKQGLATYNFDFCGGGWGSKSAGTMLDMTVLTEAEDLNKIIDHFKADSRFSCILLWGASQGGFVSTYVAGTRPEDVAGLVLLYPAFVLQDDSRRRNPDPDSGPDTMDIMGIPVGKIYDRDAQSFDIYEVMKKYPGNVLIFHGTADRTAPLFYSERAVKTFPHAKLITVDGAGHGFYGKKMRDAAEAALQFMI